MQQAADNATHEKHGDEHGHQRNSHRDDGEANFPGAFDCCLQRRFAELDVADDVLQHDDGVIDDEADRKRERQQRQVVEAVAEAVHQGEGAGHRNGQRQRRNGGGRQIAQEEQDDEDDQKAGDEQGELHVVDALADRNAAVVERGHFNGCRQLFLKAWQRALDGVHRFDGVGAGLALDGQHDGAFIHVPCGDSRVLDAIDRRGDLFEPQWRAIAPGDDQRPIIFGFAQLTVVFDGEALPFAIDQADWLVNVGLGDRLLQFVKADVAGGQLVGVGANAHGVLLRTENEYLRDAVDR